MVLSTVRFLSTPRCRYTCMRMYIYIYIHMYMYIYNYTYTFVHIYIYTYIYIYQPPDKWNRSDVAERANFADERWSQQHRRGEPPPVIGGPKGLLRRLGPVSKDKVTGKSTGHLGSYEVTIWTSGAG